MTTTVEYNVDKAINNLNRLNSKVQEAGNKANKSFNKGGKGAKVFDKALSKIPGKAGSVVSGIRGIASSVGPMAAGIGVAAGAIASVVAQFIDFNEIMKDSLKTIQGFKQATKTIQETKDAISSLFDAEVNRNNQLAREAVKLDQADSSARQRALEVEIEAGKDALDVLKDELGRRQTILSEAVKKEEDLRKRLADRQSGDVTAFAGFDADLRAAKLNQEARAAAERGDVDRAEALEKEAQAVAQNAKNRAFANADAQKTADAINQGLEEQIDKVGAERQELEGQVSVQEKLIQQAEEKIDRAEKLVAEERRLTREFSEQLKILKQQDKANRRSQTADSAARQIEKGARDVLTNVRFGDLGAFEALKNLPSELLKFATDRGDQVAVRELAEEAGKPAREIATLLQRLVSDPGSVTGRDVQGQAGNVNQLTNIVAELQAQRGRGELDGSSEIFLKRLEELLQSVTTDVIGGGAKFIGARGVDTGLREGSQGATRDDMSEIRDVLLKQPQEIGREVTNALQGRPSRAASAGAGQAAEKPQSQGGSVPATNAQASNITVNAIVKGGIIDAEVTREITRIIRQELRKQTSAAPVA